MAVPYSDDPVEYGRVSVGGAHDLGDVELRTARFTRFKEAGIAPAWRPGGCFRPDFLLPREPSGSNGGGVAAWPTITPTMRCELVKKHGGNIAETLILPQVKHILTERQRTPDFTNF